MSLVQIRRDLKEDYSFSTNSGILVDPDSTYESRYINEDEFQIMINGNWETIEGIDFEFLN